MWINLYQHAKNQSIPSVHSWETINFRVQRPDWLHPFLAMPNQKNVDQILIFVNFVSTCKKWGCFINLCWRKDWFKNPTIWMVDSILAYISEQGLSLIEDLWKNAANKFLIKFKKSYSRLFLAHFSNFQGQKKFSQKIRLCHAQLDKGFENNVEIQRNLMTQFQENTSTDSRMEGQTDPISEDPSG